MIAKGFKHKEKKYRSRNQDKSKIRHAVIFFAEKKSYREACLI
jgi:hypothetical protein